MVNLKQPESKAFHLYGMGNALVDIEFKASDQLLQQLEIHKGHMTLVDRKRQEEILQALAQDQGQAPSEMAWSCGGSAANSLIAATQWGSKTFYSCKVANDREGVFFLDDLKRHDVESLQQGSSGGETGRCLLLITPDAQRSMNTHLGVSAQYSTQEVVASALRASECLYIEGFLVASPPSQEAAVQARALAQAHGVKTALTFSDVNMVVHFRSQMQAVLGEGVDVLFANEEELLAFSQQGDLSSAMESMRPFARVMAITRGSHGALIWDGQQLSEVAAPSVTPVDSNGAGDMFAGVFLSAMISQGMPPRGAGQLACFCASHLVQKWGPRLSDKEMEQVMAMARTELGEWS